MTVLPSQGYDPRLMPRSASAARERPDMSRPWHPLVLLPLAMAAWVYFPITRVYFFADDYVHPASIASDPMAAFLLRPVGGHNCLAWNIVFLATYRLVGLRADLYYWSVLLTHLLNVALLFSLLRVLTASATLACFGAALWGTSPLLAQTLCWYAVFGQVMVATVMLFVLHATARLAAAEAPLRTRTACAWIVLLLIGTTLFGVGLGVALTAPLVLFLLLPDAWHRRAPRGAFLALPAVAVALYFGLRWVANRVEPLQPEEMGQLLFAQSGFDAVIAMFAHLLAFSMAGTALGFFLPVPYPNAASEVAIAAFGAGLTFAAWRGDWATRRALLAMLVLACGIYLVVALGRANIYRMFDISFEQGASVFRYHYAGFIPVTVLLCLVLQRIGRLGGLRAVPRGLALAAGLGVLVLGYRRSGVAIDERFAGREFFANTLRGIATAVAAQPEGATVYLENLTSPQVLLGSFIPDRLFPGRAGVFLLTHRSDTLDGRRVRFIERDPDVIAWYLGRPETRLAQLLVRPENVPKRP